MIVAIRDDDTCFFTRPEQLSSVYNEYWDICPVTLSVIPFIDSSVVTLPPVILIPEKYQGQGKLYPVGENEELIHFLRDLIKKRYIGISLHGYCHKTINGKPEFVTSTNLEEKVKEAKAYLEKLLNYKIRVFIPPNNSLSVVGVKAVIDAKMNILPAYGFYPWERPLTYKSLMNFGKLSFHYLKHKRNHPYPYVLDFEKHKEFGCVELGRGSTLEQLRSSFHFLRSKGANMCIATHYTTLYFIPEIRKIFYGFMNYVFSNYSKEVQFATADNLFEVD